MVNISIALDGPAGAGKSTIAKIIAKAKKLTYIDTGAMYRAITLKILRYGKNVQEEQIKKILSDSKIDIDGNDIFLDGKLVTEEIRKPEVSNFVSHVAKISFVRMKMVELQRKIAANKNVIMDGRDIGTYVLPNATYKFFLTASIDERAKRRFTELKEKGFNVTFEEVKNEMEKRDKIDTEREFAPLRQAEDAIVIDTTGKCIQEVVDEILYYLK
ncbi:(d)CMP kinase [Crassaminicella thermophila]|uniref:Cytidylate kinase n=1 Tax=Crassaminicella thermophila TaxID=2599308 RepID=A0A5C0SKA2_CRATE|nr:(d)CMP kinase [Crassaminicella thermophila]QEK13618.1 (d)CMP kinase [Crassaminicella thermophila]